MSVDAGVQAVMTVIDAAREPHPRDLAGQLWRRTRAQGREPARRHAGIVTGPFPGGGDPSVEPQAR